MREGRSLDRLFYDRPSRDSLAGLSRGSFETMVFGGDYDGYQKRYTTYGDAKIGHWKIVDAILQQSDPADDDSWNASKARSAPEIWELADEAIAALTPPASIGSTNFSARR